MTSQHSILTNIHKETPKLDWNVLHSVSMLQFCCGEWQTFARECLALNEIGLVRLRLGNDSSWREITGTDTKMTVFCWNAQDFDGEMLEIKDGRVGFHKRQKETIFNYWYLWVMEIEKPQMGLKDIGWDFPDVEEGLRSITSENRVFYILVSLSLSQPLIRISKKWSLGNQGHDEITSEHHERKSCHYWNVLPC